MASSSGVNYFQKSPIAKLGYPSLLEYGIFKRYLRVPPRYLKVIFQLYPGSLQKVPLELSQVIQLCDTKHWEALRKDMSVLTPAEANMQVKYKIAGIPPMYIASKEMPACAGPTLGVVEQLAENPAGFAKMGKVLYFHSEFENNSMLAASRIAKGAIKAGVECYMVTFSFYMSKIKEFDNSTDALSKYKKAELLMLPLIGTEYIAQSGFTEATLMELLRTRQVAGKSTIMSSHLTPTEFGVRYFDLLKIGATSFKFEDQGMALTIGQLAKELEALKK